MRRTPPKAYEHTRRFSSWWRADLFAVWRVLIGVRKMLRTKVGNGRDTPFGYYVHWDNWND